MQGGFNLKKGRIFSVDRSNCQNGRWLGALSGRSKIWKVIVQERLSTGTAGARKRSLPTLWNEKLASILVWREKLIPACEPGALEVRKPQQQVRAPSQFQEILS